MSSESDIAGTIRPDWRAALRAEAAGSAARLRLGPALSAVGWVHLAAFLACQAIVRPEVKSDPRHAGLWMIDVAGSLAALRMIAGRGWYRDSPALGLIVRVWGTYLILTFSLATLNTLSGWERDWFKPPWATLASFGFATMAWLFDARFLLLAVQMYATGLLMIAFPSRNYLIFGASWWLALQILAWTFRPGRHRLTGSAGP